MSEFWWCCACWLTVTLVWLHGKLEWKGTDVNVISAPVFSCEDESKILLSKKTLMSTLGETIHLFKVKVSHRGKAAQLTLGWFRPKYLKSFWTGCFDILKRHSWSPEDESCWYRQGREFKKLVEAKTWPSGWKYLHYLTKANKQTKNKTMHFNISLDHCS